jgi:hypothetical protein
MTLVRLGVYFPMGFACDLDRATQFRSVEHRIVQSKPADFVECFARHRVIRIGRLEKFLNLFSKSFDCVQMFWIGTAKEAKLANGIDGLFDNVEIASDQLVSCHPSPPR